MADKRGQSDSSAKRSQLASFSIQDILHLSTSDSDGFRIQGDPSNGRHHANEAAWKKHSVKSAKCGAVLNGSKESETGKRIRTIFTQEQLDKLEASFERQQYMIRSERSQLAAGLRLQEAQVKVWFQNRRIKWRKQQHETTMAKIRAYQETATARQVKE